VSCPHSPDSGHEGDASLHNRDFPRGNPRELPKELLNRKVLVTGGTGSTGRALVRWLQNETTASEIIVYSRDEQKHHEFLLDDSVDSSRVTSMIGDVRDLERLKEAMQGVSLVFHTAAMKHVHLVELNPIEAHKTNVVGTRNIISVARECGVQRVIANSTDKAVDPINVYGNTKFLMEMELIQSNRENPVGPRFDVIRHGNLMGSKGSVIPLFIQQARHGVMTLTSPAMTRFWIGEQDLIDAFHRCLHTSHGGEIHVPKSPACRIDVLAEAISHDAPQEVTGPRLGEKQHEALTSIHERTRLREHETHLVVHSDSPPLADLGIPVNDEFQLRSDTSEQLDSEEMRQLLKSEGWL